MRACVRACVCVCVCVHVRAECVCSESMNDVTDNPKNTFGIPWTPCTSPVLDQCMKTSECY